MERYSLFGNQFGDISPGFGGTRRCALLAPARGGSARLNQRGQALTEMAFAVVMLTFLMMGIIEFGRAFMVVNSTTHAVRDGARSAAVAPASSRDETGLILTSAKVQIETNVVTTIEAFVGAGSGFTAGVTQATEDGTPIVRVTATGVVPAIFRIGMTSFNVSRTVTFRDEGR